MKPSKRGLGRGLSNLLPYTSDAGVQPVIQENPNYQEVEVSEIHSNPNQPRKIFPEREIQELSQSFHSVGMIEPLVVRRIDNHYQLISGERRLRASLLAGFKKIPVVIKQVNDLQAIEMSIIENIQREDLNPVEESRAYQNWIDRTGEKPSALAMKLGRDRTTVTNLLRLLKLPPEILNLIEEKKLTPGQARPLLGIADSRKLKKLTQRIIQEGWSSRKVEDEVVSLTNPLLTSKNSHKKDPNTTHLENQLRTYLSTKIEISHRKNGKGKLLIHYSKPEELERILEIIGFKS